MNLTITRKLATSSILLADLDMVRACIRRLACETILAFAHCDRSGAPNFKCNYFRFLRILRRGNSGLELVVIGARVGRFHSEGRGGAGLNFSVSATQFYHPGWDK